MYNLKLFGTETEYNNEASGFKYPTVSYVVECEVVKWMDVQEKYKREYLTFEALESGTFTLTVPSSVDSTYMTSISYSLDNGETWVDTTIDNTAQTITTPTINAGSKVLWKGVGKQMAKTSSVYSCFSSTGNFTVNGNIMSLLYGDEFANQVTFPSGSTYNFSYLFKNDNKLISAENLTLPATTLVSSCYYDMFFCCTSLTTAPVLPATTLAYSCYYYMFASCTSLTTPPQLPATTLAQSCYAYMFNGCTSLATAPELPVTTLQSSCYLAMFQGCTSLTTAPDLPATTLTQDCYQNMFNGCRSLTTAPTTLPATTLQRACYQGMFQSCTALTTAPELPATTLATYCYASMFYECTSLTTAPTTLPATTLAQRCYQGMFQSCTALTTAPELPATTLVNNCYLSMFQNCTNLNNIKAMFTTTPSTSYTSGWVQGVAATGTFVKNSAATWNVTGTYGVPTGWTVETASA